MFRNRTHLVEVVFWSSKCDLAWPSCQSGIWKGPGGLSGKEIRTATCVGPYYAGVCTATCPTGKAVIAGGCYTAYPGNTWQTAWAVRATYPSSDTSWTCQMGEDNGTNRYNQSYTVYAICL